MKTRKPTRSATLLCATLAAAAGLLGVTDAMAIDTAPPGMRSVTVNYGDVNLTTLAGASTLYHRLQGAAHSVCGDPGRSLDELQSWKGCYQGAIDAAVASVNSPIVTAIHRKQSA
jgi:UrcA family protein